MRTLEEVKEYFKGVEIAKCVASKKEFNFADADERGIHYSHNAYWIVGRNSPISHMVYSPNSDEFSEIISKPVFSGSEIQFYSEVLNEWFDLSPDRKYRLKPDYSKEIAELEKKIQELKNK